MMVVVVGATGRCSGWEGGGACLCDERLCFEDQSGPGRSDWIVPVKTGAEVHKRIQMRIRVRLMTAVVAATVGWR